MAVSKSYRTLGVRHEEGGRQGVGGGAVYTRQSLGCDLIKRYEGSGGGSKVAIKKAEGSGGDAKVPVSKS